MMKQPRPLSKALALMAVGLSMVLVQCRPAPDLEAWRREILDLHRQMIDAHLKKDVRFIVDHMADGYFSVQNGEIRHPSRQDMAAEFEEYLGTTTFTEYRDLRQPIVGFSKDGSIAWLIVQVRVAGRNPDGSGGEKDFGLTWAWITLFERRGDGWVWLGEASNYKRGN